ncbi:hypothetical protein, partial, partial [Parasitella parasitica]
MTPSGSVTANHDADGCQINETNNNTEGSSLSDNQSIESPNASNSTEKNTAPENIQISNSDLPNSSNEENNNKPDMSGL